MPLPANGPITQGFGRSDVVIGDWVEGFNVGVDIGVKVGTTVRAVVSGVVIATGDQKDGWGTSIKILDNFGNIHNYGHLSSSSVKEGQFVSAGKTIGKSGNTGLSTGPHLSYDVQNASGKYFDPVSLLSDEPKIVSQSLIRNSTGPNVDLSRMTPEEILQFRDGLFGGNMTQQLDPILEHFLYGTFSGISPAQRAARDQARESAGIDFNSGNEGINQVNEALLWQQYVAELGAGLAWSGLSFNDLQYYAPNLTPEEILIARGAYNQALEGIQSSERPLTPEELEAHRSNLELIRANIDNIRSMIEERQGPATTGLPPGLDLALRTPSGSQAARDYYAFGTPDPRYAQDADYTSIYRYLESNDPTEGNLRKADYEAGGFDAVAGRPPRDKSSAAYEAGFQIAQDNLRKSGLEDLGTQLINVISSIDAELAVADFDVNKVLANFQNRLSAWSEAARNYETMFKYSLPRGAKYVPGFQPEGVVSQIYSFLGAPEGTGVQEATPVTIDPFRATGSIAADTSKALEGIPAPTLGGEPITAEALLSRARQIASQGI
jgi:hypothetical protein